MKASRFALRLALELGLALAATGFLYLTLERRWPETTSTAFLSVTSVPMTDDEVALTRRVLDAEERARIAEQEVKAWAERSRVEMRRHGLDPDRAYPLSEIGRALRCVRDQELERTYRANLSRAGLTPRTSHEQAKP